MKENLPLFVDEAFPVLIDVKYDVETVNVLKDLAFGRISEFTAICTYLFQHWDFSPEYEDIAKTLERISEVEMTHIDALGNAIVAFGGKADFAEKSKVWCASNIDLTENISEAIKHNITGEQNAIRDYKNAINLVKNESLKRLFERIIKDEELHIICFNDILNSLD